MRQRQIDRLLSVSFKFANTQVSYDGFLIRPLQRGDLDDLATWPKFKQQFSWANFPASTPQLQNRWYKTQQKPHVSWLGVRHDLGGDNTLITRCSFTEPISGDAYLYGIVVRPDLLDRGLGTQVTRIMLQYAFEISDIDRVWLESKYDNPRAHRVWEKVGFQRLGEHFRREVFGRYDLYIAFEFLRSQRHILPQIDIETPT